MVSGTVKVTDGYKFTTRGVKRLVLYYDGVNTGEFFDIRVDAK